MRFIIVDIDLGQGLLTTGEGSNLLYNVMNASLEDERVNTDILSAVYLNSMFRTDKRTWAFTVLVLTSLAVTDEDIVAYFTYALESTTLGSIDSLTCSLRDIYDHDRCKLQITQEELACRF